MNDVVVDTTASALVDKLFLAITGLFGPIVLDISKEALHVLIVVDFFDAEFFGNLASDLGVLACDLILSKRVGIFAAIGCVVD